MDTLPSAELLRALFDHSAVPKWVYDRTTFRFLRVNDAAVQHYGYTREEFLAMTVLDIRPSEDAPLVQAESQLPARDDTSRRSTWRHTKKDGSLIDVEVQTADLDLHGRPACLVTLRDVTDERRVVEVLRRNEQRFRDLVENSADGLYLLSAGGTLLFVSSASRALLGYEPEALVGRQGLDLVHPDDRPYVSAARRASLESPGVAIRAVARHAHGDGGWRWLESVRVNRLDDPSIAAVVVHTRDVTDQKLAEEALHRSEESFRAAIEGSPDLVVVVREGRVAYANAAVLAALGIASRDGIVGRPVLEFIHPDDRARAAAALDLYAAGQPGGRESAAEELRVIRADGSPLFVDFRGVAVAFDGAPAVLEFGRDVTERRRLEARLALADRMSSLGTLAAGIAHEINNPVSYALANVGFVAEALAPLLAGADPSEAQEVSDALREARQGIERVRDIVRDLKTFSRGDDDALGPVDLFAAIDAACSMAGNEIKHRARLVKEYAPEARWVRGNDGKLAQVFVNLLVNAAQAIPDGDAGHNLISIRAALRGPGTAIVEVRDTGSGIAAEHLPRLFDPFFTTKSKAVGTGLGLAVCHNIVRAHGGAMEVESTPGKGSCFRLVLAACEPPRPGDRAPAPTAAGRRARVLVVDDEIHVCQAIVRVLGSAHDVRTIGQSRAALDLVREGARFDAILCDVMMPEMTGVQLHAALACEAPEQARRLAFMTGGVFSGDVQRQLEASGRPVVDKPFTKEAIVECVRRLQFA
jgi:two-component system cell cycle sensor histidine kinase/response regulator CckA